MGKADFNQTFRQRNQLVVAAHNFRREQKLSPVLQSTLSKNMEEQLKFIHKEIDVVDCANKRICDTVAIQGGQPGDLSCSNSSVRTEEGRRKFSTIFVCQL